MSAKGIAVAVALLLILYVTAYYQMVRGIGPAGIPVYETPISGRHKSPPSLPDEINARFFAPVHWVDRLIRPEVWKRKE